MMSGQSPRRPVGAGERDILVRCLAVSFAGGVKFLFDGATVYVLDYGFNLLLVAILVSSLPVRDLVFCDGRTG